MKNNFIVFHAKDIKKAMAKVGNRPFGWFYLGHDLKQRENISQVLKRENRYFIRNLLQEVAYAERQAFLDFIAELGLHQQNKLHWWASNIAYKSPFASDLFLNWCYMAVFEKVRADWKETVGKRLVVMVQDRWLYRSLWQRYGKDGLQFLSRKSVLPEMLRLIAGGIIGRGYFLLKAMYRIWQTKRIPYKNNTSNSEADGKQVYIYSWIEDRFFPRSGELRDAYLGRLAEIMDSEGSNIIYMTPPFLNPDLKKKCLGYSKYKFIFLDRYINFHSILRSLFSLFRMSIPKNSDSRFLLSKILLQCEATRELPNLAVNLLYYLAFKQWLKGLNQKKRVIIYPFENQPWEKMLCLAARELDKNIKLVGYQHGSVPLLLLNYFLGGGEASTMPLPHLIVTNGESALSVLKNAEYGEVELVNGGALRFEYLHKLGRGPTRHEKELKTVLVALPSSRSLTEEMLLAVFDAFKDSAERKIRFVIKFHPDVSLERLTVQLPPWPAHFEKTDKPMSEILDDVDLVIYSSSTVGLETLLNGVPVVSYCSEHTLNLDPLDTFDEGIVKNCSENNIKQVILSVLDGEISHPTQKTIPEVGSLNRVFSPVNEEVWRQVVKQ